MGHCPLFSPERVMVERESPSIGRRDQQQQQQEEEED